MSQQQFEVNRIGDAISFLKDPCVNVPEKYAHDAEKYVHEVLCFYCYSYARLLTNKSAIQLTAKKRDPVSPDFEVLVEGKTVGLEITRATHPQYMQVSRIAAQNPIDTYFEFPNLAPHENIPRERLDGLVHEVGQPLREPGYMGDQPQNIWCAHMSYAIKSKTKKLNSGSYALFDSNELLIFDNTHERGFIDHHSVLYGPAIDYLKEKGYECDEFPMHFNAVHILSRKWKLYLDVFGQNRVVDFPEDFTLPAL